MTIGIDEVGRGPIAGPVCLCAFAWKGTQRSLVRAVEKMEMKLCDSKKLSAAQREAWFAVAAKWKREGRCDFALAYASAKTIDRIGIAPSIRSALAKSLGKVAQHGGGRARASCTVLLDGGLRAPAEFKKQSTIIKGDEKEAVIALASIVAKVSRDRLMKRLSKKLPAYGFDAHVGYGTRAHYAAIKKHGLSPAHRASFLTRLKAGI